MLVSDHTTVPSRAQGDGLNFQISWCAYPGRSAPYDHLNCWSPRESLVNVVSLSKGGKLGVQKFFLFFWNNCFSCVSVQVRRFVSLLPGAHTCMLVCSWAHPYSENVLYVVFSSGCVFLGQCKQNCSCFGTCHHLSFSTVLTGPAPSNTPLVTCVSCYCQCCKNADVLSCSTWISCAEVVCLRNEELSWSHKV